jgi:hypothetical protein
MNALFLPGWPVLAAGAALGWSSAGFGFGFGFLTGGFG